MRRGAVIGVMIGCAALAACLVAVLGRADPRLANPAATAAANSVDTPAAAEALAASVDIATPATATTDPATQPLITDVNTSDFTVPGPAMAEVTSATAAAMSINRLGSREVPVRRYDPVVTHGQGAGHLVEPWAVLVWAHGGSFIHGGLNNPEADWVSREFAAAGIRVYSVDYVLASDTVKAPAPANDVAAVAEWVTQAETAPVFIGGASAGAHLAALAALDRADGAAKGVGEAAAGLLLEYPTMHREQRDDAAISRATAKLREGLRFQADRIDTMYINHLGDISDAEIAQGELVAGEIDPDRLALLPPTVIVNADLDDLRASGEQFAEQLAIAGVQVIEYTQQGTTHGYMNRPTESAATLASAQQSIDRFVQGARNLIE